MERQLISSIWLSGENLWFTGANRGLAVVRKSTDGDGLRSYGDRRKCLQPFTIESLTLPEISTGFHQWKGHLASVAELAPYAGSKSDSPLIPCAGADLLIGVT